MTGRQTCVLAVTGLAQEYVLDVQQPPGRRPPAVADDDARIDGADSRHNSVHGIKRGFPDVVARRIFFRKFRRCGAIIVPVDFEVPAMSRQLAETLSQRPFERWVQQNSIIFAAISRAVSFADSDFLLFEKLR